MNHDLTVETLPELGQIKTLLEDLMPANQPPAAGPRGRQPAGNGAPSQNGVRGPGAPAVLGAFTLQDFFHGVNWSNRSGYQSPLRRPVPPTAVPAGERRVLGALPLKEFFSAVNWRNVAGAPALDLHAPAQPDHARLVIETFMNEIDWE